MNITGILYKLIRKFNHVAKRVSNADKKRDILFFVENEKR